MLLLYVIDHYPLLFPLWFYTNCKDTKFSAPLQIFWQQNQKNFAEQNHFFNFSPTKIALTHCNSWTYTIFSSYFAPTFPLLCPYFATTNYQPTTDQPPKCLTPAVLHLFTPTLLI